MQIENLTGENFKQTISTAKKPVIVDFYADWCMPCKAISPLLDEIAAEHADRVTVYKVNIDESPDIANEFGVKSIPNLVSFKAGNLHKRIIGGQPKENILDLIN